MSTEGENGFMRLLLKMTPALAQFLTGKSPAWLFAACFLSIVAACAHVNASNSTHVVASSPKIASSIAAVAQQLADGVSPANFATGKVRCDAAGKIQVYVSVSDLSRSSQKQLETGGLRDAVVSPEMHIVQGWILPTDLDKIAGLVFVVSISPPRYAKVH